MNIRIMVNVDETNFDTIHGELRRLGVEVYSVNEDLGIIKGKTDESKIKGLIESQSVAFVDYK